MRLKGWAWFVTPLLMAIPVAALAVDIVEDAPATHNMLVVGTESVFLSHLPMFDSVSKDGTSYTSPHRYQVILQVAFQRPVGGDLGLDITSAYARDREANPSVRMYTLSPEDFTLSRLFAPAGQPGLNSFKATVFRGHLERGGEAIRENPVTVQMLRVVYAHRFNVVEEKPHNLTYVLFGDDLASRFTFGSSAIPPCGVAMMSRSSRSRRRAWNN